MTDHHTSYLFLGRIGVRLVGLDYIDLSFGLTDIVGLLVYLRIPYIVAKS